MKELPVRLVARLAFLLLLFPFAIRAQATQQAGTLSIAGQTDQAPLVRMRGKSYVDVESLARITHASVRYQGNQIVLTLPQASANTNPQTAATVKTPQLSGGFLGAEVEALTAIREWRVSLVNAVQNNYPVTADWTGRLRRSTEKTVQLAVAAASTDSDQKALELLRNEFANMQQMNDQFVAIHASVNYISPDSFNNNAADQKILACERGLMAMASTKQFQDEPSCH
jgi:hypothetical protein